MAPRSDHAVAHVLHVPGESGDAVRPMSNLICFDQVVGHDGADLSGCSDRSEDIAGESSCVADFDAGDVRHDPATSATASTMMSAQRSITASSMTVEIAVTPCLARVRPRAYAAHHNWRCISRTDVVSAACAG